MKFKEYNQEQPWLIPPDIEDEIPSDDICRVINDIVDTIDTSSIERKYKEEGNTAYHPKMMIKSLFYSYSQKIFSSRVIAKEHERNIFYWYLSGKQRPDFRTISLFRKKHAPELKHIFAEIVTLCIRLGLVGFKTMALDGTKIHANANKEKFRDAQWIDRELSALKISIDEAFDEADRIDREEDDLFGEGKRGDEIPEDVADEKKRREKLKKLQEELKKKKLKKVHETDSDARMMKNQGRYVPSYNCQALVDEKHQVILSANVIDDAHDWYQVKPRLEDLKQTHSRKPEVLLADTGYCDGESLEYLVEEKINGFIPDKMPKHIKLERDGRLPEKMKYKKDQFIYNKEKDVYICPEGNELARTSRKMTIAVRKQSKGVPFHTYQCVNQACAKSSLCHNAKNGRKIYRYENQKIRDVMAVKMRSDDGWKIYKSRMKIIEPVFGNIKFNMGFSRFNLRGLAKTRGEFFIMACIHNMIKIKNYLKDNEIVNLKAALHGV